MKRRTRSLAVAAPVVLLLLASPGTALGQVGGLAPDMREIRYIGVGYSAHIPKVLAGIGAFFTTPSFPVGFFATGRLSLDSPGDNPFFIPGITHGEALELGDGEFGRRDEYRMASAGIVRVVGHGTALFAGAGYTRVREFREHYDESEVQGDQGFYWVEDPDAARSGANYTAGMIIQIGRHIFVQGGVETFPKGLAFGLFGAVPF